MLVSLTVGKVDAGVTVLLTSDKRLARTRLQRFAKVCPANLLLALLD